MKILLIGHACSPRLGSEASFAWNWAWQLSRIHQVWAIAHPYDRDCIEMLLANHPRPNLRFEWVDVPRWIDPWAWRADGKGLRLHYLLWLPMAYRKAIELHERIAFDLAHHVSYGTISAPPPVGKLSFPLIWGPIGGAQQAPYAFRSYFGRGWVREIIRYARVRLLQFYPRLRKAARTSAIVLATNRDTYALIASAGGRDVRYFLDSGIESTFAPGPGTRSPAGELLTLLWAGRMHRRRALPLLLEALARVDDLSVRLLIAGDGEMRESWEALASSLHLGDKVEFLGRVPWNTMTGLYRRADAFVFTSLQESFGTQVLEAMGNGLAILTLDLHGVRTFVPSEAGIKVPVASPEQTLAGLADGIRRLALFPEERKNMGKAAYAYAQTQTWEKRAERMSKLYAEVLSRTVHHERKGSSVAARRKDSRLVNHDTSAHSALTKPSYSSDSPGSVSIHRQFTRATFNVLGVRTQAVQIKQVIEQMLGWIRARDGCRSVAAADMHCIVEAQRDPSYKSILNATDLVVPDGMPLVWLGRRKGHILRRRVYGPDLLVAFCEEGAGLGYRHFFYGGEPGVAERLAESLKIRFPGLNVVGTCSPPFRPLSADEDAEMVEMINRAAPDVLWVGLGAPKQERWMHEHKDQVRVPVLVGVGAAFDLLSGRRRQAPRWMREHGFEWLFRLLQEPRRLWRRYLVYGSQFIAYLALDSLRLKNFEPSGSRFTGRAPDHRAHV
jgi:exopolysaccharide biosynthesis WecB/TagA/CpsF family protein